MIHPIEKIYPHQQLKRESFLSNNDLPKFLRRSDWKPGTEIPISNLAATLPELTIFIKTLAAQTVPSGLDFWPDDSVRIAVVNLSNEVLDFPPLVLPHSLAQVHVVFIIENSFNAAGSSPTAVIVDWCNSQKILALVLQIKETETQNLLSDFGHMFGKMGETAICTMVDFADIFELLGGNVTSARLITGVGQTGGENRVEMATVNALVDLKLKRGKAEQHGAVAIVAFNRRTAKLHDAALAMKLVRKFLPAHYGFVYGLSYAADLDADEMRVTILQLAIDVDNQFVL